ncbi:MAG: prepilin-type N-terminal cleavage/methylation domain-containing protein [Firmicutes bacterium]|nr:prepilin-type N-terminal cleavage/methylation domain-containing protein [Bacillota bacterium]
MKYLNKKGFTLIEVIATVAIASLVMIALISFFSVVSNVFINSALESEERLVISNTKAYLKNELVYKVAINSSGDATYNKLEFTSGKLYKNGVQVFTDDFYGNTKIYGTVKGTGSVLTFTLQVQNGTTNRSEEYVVKTLNKTDINISTPVSILYYK